MKIKVLFYKLWRTWLWVSVLLGLILFLPFSLILISSQKTYWLFHLFCKYWCRLVLIINGFWYVIHKEAKILNNRSYIICPNHTSKFDIILLFATFPNTFVFMGKKNVSNIKFFDWFYDKTMITFDRDNISSSFKAYRKADKILKDKISIVIFPEGRVPEKKIRLGKFKLGAFKLAISNKVPIIPVTFVDNKQKYPENDFRVELGIFRVFLHKPIAYENEFNNDAKILMDQTFNIMSNTLRKYESKQ